MSKVNPESIRARLLNIAREQSLVFQELLNRYGAEQFFVQACPLVDQFIFKGGSLLAYLIESERQTRDLDFSIREVSHEVAEACKVIDTILALPANDGLKWLKAEGSPLLHPEMDHPGVRMKCIFMLGTARGMVRMDLAKGDVVKPVKTTLERIRYRNKPLIGPDFQILAYPSEAIFAEKLQIAIKRGGKNTRMKDYYDLFKLSKSGRIDANELKSAIEQTFAKRATNTQVKLKLNNESMAQLQVYWAAFVRKMKITDAPASLSEVVLAINTFLKEIEDGCLPRNLDTNSSNG